MGKFATYTIIMSGLILLFHLTGLLPNISAAELLNLLLNPENFENIDFNVKALAAIAGGGILAGVIVGFVTGNTELAAAGVVIAVLSSLLWDFISVYQVVNSANPIISKLVFSPLLFLWIATIFEWWRGVTT